MSAIKPFKDAPNGDCPSCRSQSADDGFGLMTDVPAIEPIHAGLTRTLWIRKELEKLMVGRSFEIVEGDSKQLMLQVTPKLPKAGVPWFVGTQDHGNYYLFSTNGKMRCPTFDLTAGAPLCGGSCPGSVAGQSVVPAAQREAAARAVERVTGNKVDLPRAICASCYAQEGNYPSPHVQAGEIARYWWARELVESGNAAEFIDTMSEAIARLEWKPDFRRQFAVAHAAHGIKPIRIHSSGDFFSLRYLEAWVEIANNIASIDPDIRFWAPSRIWVIGADFSKALSKLKTDNLVVRPSSFHFNETAPGRVQGSNAAGTSSWLRDLVAQAQADGAFDFNCVAYAVKPGTNDDLAKSCEFAIDPDGRKHCRACWTHPNLRICYTAH